MSEPAESQLEPGDLVGEYRVEARLGEGAFGTVFRAVHPLIGKVVAIKVLKFRYSTDPEVVGRFMVEARAVNQIRHRNIIDIFAFGQLPDGRQYHVMELLEGETLEAVLEREGMISLARAVPILRGIGRALDAAHAANIAHRDLKPENIFLANEPDGGVVPKLLDFGIAKLLAPEPGVGVKTRTGTSVGTPYFMSPEQARGIELDHRTDLYSFGVVVYLLLTGTYPIDGDDYVTILMGQLTVTPEPPSHRNPTIPRAVDDIIAALMQKDPADRPSDLRTVVQALDDIAAGRPHSLRPLPPAPKPISTHVGPAAHAHDSTVVPVPLPADRRHSTALPRRSRAPLAAVLAAACAVAAVIVVVATHRRHVPTAAPGPSPPPPTIQVIAPMRDLSTRTEPPDAAELAAAPPDHPDAPAATRKAHPRQVDPDLLNPF